MKKLIILVAFAVCCSAGTSAFSADYIVGVKGGYFLWDSFMKESNVDNFKDMKRGDGVLYGPIFSVLFTPDVSFSLSGFVGRQSAHWFTRDGTSAVSTDIASSNNSFNVFRTDLDSALSLRIFEYLRLFAGYKYLRMDIEARTVASGFDYPGPALVRTVVGENEVTTVYHGPALGLGLALPLSEKYFLAVNLSAVYMPGKMEMSSDGYRYDISGLPPYTRTPTIQPDQKSDMKMWGFNLEPSAGMRPGDGLPIVTLGLRVQWTRVQFKEDLGDLSNQWLDDWIYGVFVGVMYEL